MIITCENCQAKFKTNPNLIKKTGSKVRCSNCKNVFTVYKSQQNEAIIPNVKINAIDDLQVDKGIFEAEADNLQVDNNNFEAEADEEKTNQDEENLDALFQNLSIKKNEIDSFEEQFNINEFTEEIDFQEPVLKSLQKDRKDILDFDFVLEEQEVEELKKRGKNNLDDLDNISFAEEIKTQDANLGLNDEVTLKSKNKNDDEYEYVYEEDELDDENDYDEEEDDDETENTYYYEEEEDYEDNYDSDDYESYETGDDNLGLADEVIRDSYENNSLDDDEDDDYEDERTISAKGIKSSQALILIFSILLAAIIIGVFIYYNKPEPVALSDASNIPLIGESVVVEGTTGGEENALNVASTPPAPEEAVNDDTLGAKNLQLVGELAHKIITRDDGEQLFVVTGRVLNQYSTARNYIRIRGVIKDSDKNIVAERTVYAGNILSEKDLKILDINKILSTLSLKSGMDHANTNVMPNEIVSFMVVFNKLPKTMNTYLLEPLSSE